MRWGEQGDAPVLAVVNFTPVVRHDYRVGVPFAGEWTEIVNTDVSLPEIGSFKARHIGTASSVDSIDVVCVRFIPT